MRASAARIRRFRSGMRVHYTTGLFFQLARQSSGHSRVQVAL